MQAHNIHLVAKIDPVKYVLSRAIMSGWLAKWVVAFQEFEITCVSQKAIKGQALANFLANHPIPADWELLDDFPDENVLYTQVLPPWMMFFDGAARQEESSAGVVLCRHINKCYHSPLCLVNHVQTTLLSIKPLLPASIWPLI